MACPLFLVEMGGVEPPSENPLTELSPGAVYLLEFPSSNADKQASDLGSPFLRDGFKSNRPCTFTAHLTLRPRPRYSSAERAALRLRHCP